jgi:hypothetical protein
MSHLNKFHIVKFNLLEKLSKILKILFILINARQTWILKLNASWLILKHGFKMMNIHNTNFNF